MQVEMAKLENIYHWGIGCRNVLFIMLENITSFELSVYIQIREILIGAYFRQAVHYTGTEIRDLP